MVKTPTKIQVNRQPKRAAKPKRGKESFPRKETSLFAWMVYLVIGAATGFTLANLLAFDTCLYLQKKAHFLPVQCNPFDIAVRPAYDYFDKASAFISAQYDGFDNLWSSYGIGQNYLADAFTTQKLHIFAGLLFSFLTTLGTRKIFS